MRSSLIASHKRAPAIRCLLYLRHSRSLHEVRWPPARPQTWLTAGHRTAMALVTLAQLFLVCSTAPLLQTLISCTEPLLTPLPSSHTMAIPGDLDHDCAFFCRLLRPPYKQQQSHAVLFPQQSWDRCDSSCQCLQKNWSWGQANTLCKPYTLNPQKWIE